MTWGKAPHHSANIHDTLTYLPLLLSKLINTILSFLSQPEEDMVWFYVRWHLYHFNSHYIHNNSNHNPNSLFPISSTKTPTSSRCLYYDCCYMMTFNRNCGLFEDCIILQCSKRLTEVGLWVLYPLSALGPIKCVLVPLQ